MIQPIILIARGEEPKVVRIQYQVSDEIQIGGNQKVIQNETGELEVKCYQ